jgi:hypothetical protein
MLCCHEDLAWFSNYTDRLPSIPAVAFLSNAYRFATSTGLGRGIVPIPSEGYPFWDALTRLDHLPLHGPLTEGDVTDQARELASRRIAAVMRAQRRGRFVNKATRNVRRLRYVNALLADVSFVHVVRDPRATVASLLRVGFWPDTPVWCEGDVTPRAWLRRGGDETELAARLWACDIQRTLTDREAIAPERIVDVRYEVLVADPWGTVSALGRWAELPVTAAFRRTCSSFSTTDRNGSSRTTLTKSQLDTVTQVAGPVAERIGYTW